MSYKDVLNPDLVNKIESLLNQPKNDYSISHNYTADYLAEKVAEGLKNDFAKLANQETNPIAEIIYTLVNIADKLDTINTKAAGQLDIALEKLAEYNCGCSDCEPPKELQADADFEKVVPAVLMSSADKLDKLGLGNIANDIDNVLKILAE